MIIGDPISLSACPPGAFLHGETLGFKSEYGSVRSDDGGKSWRVTGAPDAYVIDSGEVFWGGASTHAARDALIVRPVTLALPVPALDEGAARESVEDLWQELCERDDRTSPEEYPEMCLITFDELSDFITRAHPSPPPAAFDDQVRQWALIGLYLVEGRTTTDGEGALSIEWSLGDKEALFADAEGWALEDAVAEYDRIFAQDVPPPAADEDRVRVMNPDDVPVWAEGLVTDGEHSAIAQKAEADYGGTYWSVETGDGALEWEPTHFIDIAALKSTAAKEGAA